MAEKTFEQKLAEAKSLGEKSDELNEQIARELLVAASPFIEKLRAVCDNMSPNTSFHARTKQVLAQIESGLLRDPLSVRVLEKLKGEQAAAGDKSKTDES